MTPCLVLQVSICPGGVPTGYTYFIPQEEHLESRVVTRAYMEAKMVVAMSGRSALTHPCPAPTSVTAQLCTIPTSWSVRKQAIYDGETMQG